MRASRGNGGITIIEMMVVVAVVAILLAVGVPNLYEFVVRNRVETVGNEFVANLNLARSEAIRRGTAVIVQSKGGQLWTDLGWRVYVFDDADKNGLHGAKESVTEVIREVGPIDKPMTIRSARKGALIAFWPNGKVVTAEGDPDLFRYVLCYESKLSAGPGRPRSWGVTINGQARGSILFTKPNESTGDLKMEANNAGGEETFSAASCPGATCVCQILD